MIHPLVTTQDALDACLECITDRYSAALDTEFVRVSTFYPRPGLIQIGAGGETWLLDPLADLDWRGLASWLERGSECIFHAAAEDYEVLYRLTGALPSQVFDTQVAAALLTPKTSLSLQALVEQQLGMRLDKGETRSDWTQRPLTASQLHYAAEDVRVLEPLALQLKEVLTARGRLLWMTEDMQTILTRAREHIAGGDAETQLARFGTAWRLSERAMTRLSALVRWREEAARRFDRPRKHVLSDQSVLQLALSKGSLRRNQLVQECSLTERQADRYGTELQQILADAEEEMPRAVPPPPLSKRQKGRLESLQESIGSIASDLGIAAEVLARKRDLIAVIDGRGWTPSGWRATLIGALVDAYR